MVLSDSHSTKADAAWFSSLDPERIVVAHSGPSLCVETHRHRGRVARSDRIGLVVSTIEPRKNAGFLFDWFQKTTLLPPDMELWWVGKLGWMISREELERMANPAGGRRVRFLGNVSDARALPPLPEGRLVDLPVAVRRVRLSDPRLAAARYARPLELHQLHGRI